MKKNTVEKIDVVFDLCEIMVQWSPPAARCPLEYLYSGSARPRQTGHSGKTTSEPQATLSHVPRFRAITILRIKPTNTGKQS